MLSYQDSSFTRKQYSVDCSHSSVNKLGIKQIAEHPYAMADKLPVEIWAKIALIVGPARIPTDVFPSGKYQSINAEYAKWKSSRDDLLHLSLTSKSFAALCRPIVSHWR